MVNVSQRTPRLILSVSMLCCLMLLSWNGAAARDPNDQPTASNVQPQAPLAVDLQATKVDALLVDDDGDGQADPGDTLRYTVVIRNNGSTNASGIVFSDTLDPNTEFVAGTLAVTPLARNDSYSTVGNTWLAVGTSAPAGQAAVVIAGSVLANDSTIGGDTLTIQSFDALSAQGGTVAMNIDGTFTYLPSAGFTGSDTFGYTIVNGSGATDPATVTITVGAVVWYVDDSAAGGDGRANAPFNRLTPLNGTGGAGDVDAAGSIIFLYSGTYTTGIQLEASQQLIGQGVDLVVSGFLLVSSGTAPMMSNPAGAGVQLAQNNIVRGLDIGPTSGYGIAGTNFGTLMISSVSIGDTGGVLNLGTGSVNATFRTLATTAAVSGISLNDVSGTISAGSTTLSGITGTAIMVVNSAGLTFDTNTTGALTISGAAGILTANGGTFNIAGTANTITATGGAALNISATSLGAGATFATVSSTNSPNYGIFGQNLSGNLTINGGTLTNAALQTVVIDGGNAVISYAGAISNTSNRSVEISNRTGGSVTLAGSLSDSGSGIYVHNNTGGTTTFSNASKTLSTGANTAVLLTNNTGATVNFTGGGLAITTSANATNAAFEATGGGTINVTGANNTISAVNRQAVRIIDTTIGASGATWRTISANNASNGVELNNAGSGGFSVTGIGTTDGSGGSLANLMRGYDISSTSNITLANITLVNSANADTSGVCDGASNVDCHAAVYLSTATTVSLSNVDISGSMQQGINGVSVASLTIANSLIHNSGNANNEGGIRLVNLTGTSTFTNIEVAGSAGRNAWIVNNTGSLTLNVSNSTFRDNVTGTGADGLEIHTDGNAQLTANIADSQFLGNKTWGIQVLAEGTSNASVNITTSTINPRSGVGAGIDTSANNSATLKVNIINNPEIRSNGTSAVNIFAIGSATIQARVQNNPDIKVGGAGTSGFGIRINNNEAASIVADVRNNTIGNIGFDAGIQAMSRGGTGRADATIANNTVTIVENFGLYGIWVQAQDNNTQCANVTGNAVTLTPNSTAAFRERTAIAGATVLLQGWGGSVVNTWNGNSNAPAGSVSASNNGTVGAGTCATPTHPLPSLVAATTAASAPVAPTASDAGLQVAHSEAIAVQTVQSAAAPSANAPADSLQISDQVALASRNSSTQLQAALPTPHQTQADPIQFTIGTLDAGKAITITFDALIANPVTAGVNALANQATISGSNFPTLVSDDPATVAPNDPTLTPLIAAPDLRLSKSDGGISAQPGETVAYTLSYTNTGNQGATSIILTETVPANTTFNTGASTAGWTCTPNNNTGSTCTFNIGALAGGNATGNATFAVTVVNPVAAGVTQLSNTASIADNGANGADPTPANNTATDTTPLTATPDLQLSKSDGGISAQPGETVAYTLSYTNTGNRGASGIILSETVPANTTFNAGTSTAGWTCTPNGNTGSTCSLSIGTLAGGSATGNVVFAVTVVNPVAAGVTQLSNTASIADDGANGADPTPANNTATDTTPLVATPDLQLSKSDGGISAQPGETVAYTLSYTNTGNRGASGIILTETVPANTTFNAGTSTAGWTCTPNNTTGSTCTFNVGALAGGSATGNATFAVTVVNPVAAGVTQLSNTASIADDGANGADPTPANNTATDATPLVATPDLVLSKSDGGISAQPGETVAYTLNYNNTGNRGASGIILSETVPANTTFNAGASTAGWTCTPNGNAGSTCSLSIGTLAGGNTTNSAIFAVIVTNPIGAGITNVVNTASIADDGANGADPTPANNTATDATPLVATPDLVLSKSDGGITAQPGETVAYTLSYTNTGDQVATGIILSETVPANTAFNPAASTAGWTCTPDNSSGSTCTLTVGALAGGNATDSVVFAVDTDPVFPVGVNRISNTASITDGGTNGADPTPANNSASDETPIGLEADLALTKQVNTATALPGQPITYTLVFTNAGPQIAANVVITDTLPPLLSNIAITSSRSITDTGASPPYVWDIGTLPIGAGGTITVTGNVSAALTADGVLSNTASIAGAIDPDLSNNTATVSTSVTLPRVQWSAATYSVDESAVTATLTVTLDAPNPYADVTVQYSSDGTASASDYTPTSGMLTIAAGSTTTVTLAISDDQIDEGDETVLLTLHDAVGAMLATPAQTTLTIIDDDAAGVVVIPTSLAVVEGGASASYTITLTSQPTADVTIAIITDGQTTVQPTSLTWTPTNWNTPQSVIVTAVDDPVVEGIHTSTISHSVSSSDPAYAGISVATVTATISDNDTAPPGTTLFLPLIVRQLPPAPAPGPDLVVTNISTSNDSVAVTISNAGTMPVTTAFWIDLYLNPNPAPTMVNQTWQQRASRGAVWGIEGGALPLSPGASLTLTVGDGYFHPELSDLPGSIAAGTRIYAQVDSANAATTYGNVLETHERDGGAYNNITGPVVVPNALNMKAPASAPRRTGTLLPRR